MAIIDDNTRALFKRLVVQSVQPLLPGQAHGDIPAPLTRREGSHLLAIASALALSTSAEERTLAYEIATRLAEAAPGDDAVAAAADFIFGRLGNFPGRRLFRERHDALTQIRPVMLDLEALSREEENSVEGIAGQRVTLTDFQYDFLKEMEHGDALSVSAPTSAGKSFVFSLEIIRRLRAKPEQIVYVVPTRALLRQVQVGLIHEFARSGLAGVPVRSVPLPVTPELAPAGVVYVLTQERLLSLLQSGAGEAAITTLVVDEAQGVREGSRGVVLQTAVEAVLARFPLAQVMFASPMARNPEKLLSVFGRPGRTLLETHSPVSRNLILVSSVKRRPQSARYEVLISGEKLPAGSKDLTFRFSGSVTARRAEFARAVTREGESTLVYAGGAAQAEELANAIAELEPATAGNDPEIVDFVEFVKNHVHPDYALAETLPKGVAFHYGYMPGLVRSRIEELFGAGKLRFLCCTSTLLQGVNLPAKHIILENPHRGQGKPMTRGDFLNLAGRAGRLVKEFHGNVWCLLPNDWDVKSYEGDELQDIATAFELTLKTQSHTLTDVINGQATPEATELGEAVIGKAYSDLTQAGRSLLGSEFVTNENRENLRRVDDRLASFQPTLPAIVFKRNSTILPERLQTLFDDLSARPSLEACLPLMPYESGFIDRMRSLFRDSDRTLEGVHNESYRYFAMLASKWIHDAPLGQLIAERIQYQKQQGQFRSISSEIRALMKSLETDLRYRYVKSLKAYNDVLSAVLKKKNRPDLIERLIPLHLFLECGASDSVTLGLISIGLSRTTALLVKRFVRFPDRAAPEECLAVLRRAPLEHLPIPALCRSELLQLCRA